MSDTSANRLFFHPFCLDITRRSLSRDGEPVSLTAKEFDTLLALVEARGKAVGKEALVARVWPNSYVGDGSLARNISVIRKALGEDVIETLPRWGYRLALPVTSVPAIAVPSALEAAANPDATPTQPTTAAGSAPWWKRRAVSGPALAIVLLIAIIGSRFFTIIIAKAHPSITKTSPVRSILIQKQGGLDPLDEEFKLARADGHYTHLMRNRENNGFDRWRLVTEDQNFYYRALNSAEKDFALQSDWKLTCVCALEKGAGAANIDLGADKAAPRFDLAFLQEGNRYFVALTKQISPDYQFERKIEFPGVADVNHPHTYELRYDHLARTASLWIDGQQMASGYHGHHQFQEDFGLMFGAATYLNATTSSIVFRTVRFEAR